MVLSELTTKYRIFYEELGEYLPYLYRDRAIYQELRGTSGARLYVHGDGVLAVSCESTLKFNRLLKEIPGAWGYTPCVVCFPVASLEIAAQAIHARKKRQMSLSQLDKLKQMRARKQVLALLAGTPAP